MQDQTALVAYLSRWAGRSGVFASKNADEAFYVNTDVLGESINNPSEQAAERYTVLVAIATAAPRRFITLLFTRDQRAIETFTLQGLAS